MIDGEADVTFWVPVSLLLKLLSLFCMLLLWINAKNVLDLLHSSNVCFCGCQRNFTVEEPFS